MRRLASYVARYGPEVGPKLYHALQSQAAHASVGARRKRKIARLLDERSRLLPLFDPSPSGPVASAAAAPTPDFEPAP